MFRKVLSLSLIVLISLQGFSQCAICTKTASTLGDKAAKGLNSGIIYLAFMPLIFMGFLAYRWYKSYKDTI